MYSVGQIIYTVSEKNHKIIPIKIVEQVTTKTLEGEKTEYSVSIPGLEKQKYYNLNKFKKTYEDIEVLQKELLSNAKKAIEDMILEGEILREEYFSEEKNKEPSIEEITENISLKSLKKEENKSNKSKVKDLKENNEKFMCKNDKNNVKINLGNGQVGNLNLKSLKKNIGKNEK